MDQVDTLRDGRCWSEVLCSTITIHLSDMRSRSQTLKFCVKILVISLYL